MIPCSTSTIKRWFSWICLGWLFLFPSSPSSPFPKWLETSRKVNPSIFVASTPSTRSWRTRERNLSLSRRTWWQLAVLSHFGRFLQNLLVMRENHGSNLPNRQSRQSRLRRFAKSIGEPRKLAEIGFLALVSAFLNLKSQSAQAEADAARRAEAERQAQERKEVSNAWHILMCFEIQKCFEMPCQTLWCHDLFQIFSWIRFAFWDARKLATPNKFSTVCFKFLIRGWLCFSRFEGRSATAPRRWKAETRVTLASSTVWAGSILFQALGD